MSGASNSSWSISKLETASIKGISLSGKCIALKSKWQNVP